MFDELTTSNTEAEHSALKRSSLGISHKDTMHSLFCKTNMGSHCKSSQRIQRQYKQLNMIDTETLCELSNYVVKPVFVAMKNLIQYSKQVFKSKLIKTIGLYHTGVCTISILIFLIISCH